MYSGATLSKKMTSKGNKVIASSSASRRAPFVLMTLIIITAVICATTQVLAKKLNRSAYLPPISLSIDDALQYLSRASNK